jgi:hypothetical protein
MEFPNLKLDRREVIVLARLATANDVSASDHTARVPSGDLSHQDVVFVYWHITETRPTIVDHCVSCHWQLIITHLRGNQLGAPIVHCVDRRPPNLLCKLIISQRFIVYELPQVIFAVASKPDFALPVFIRQIEAEHVFVNQPIVEKVLH